MLHCQWHVRDGGGLPVRDRRLLPQMRRRGETAVGRLQERDPSDSRASIDGTRSALARVQRPCRRVYAVSPGLAGLAAPADLFAATQSSFSAACTALPSCNVNTMASELRAVTSACCSGVNAKLCSNGYPLAALGCSADCGKTFEPL